MSFDTDDPKLTAYALGELDETQRAEVEATLTDHPEARRAVEHVRATASLLADELQGELQDALPKPVQIASARRSLLPLAIAAALVLGVGTIALVLSQRQQPSAQVVLQMPEPSANAPEAKLTEANPLSGEDRSRTVRDRVREAQKLVKEGQYDQALAVTNQILLLDPQNEYAQGSEPLIRDRAEANLPNKALNGAELQRSHYDILRYPSNSPDLSEGRTANGGLAALNTRTPSAMSPARLDVADSILLPRERSVAMERGEEPGDGALATHLQRRLPELRLDNSSLADVIEFLRDVSGANIFVDWTGLEKVGVTPDTPVSLRMRDVKFSEAMRRILDSVQQPGVRIYVSVDEGVVTISPREEMHGFNTEAYDRIVDNPFLDAIQNPLSTFSIDVDTASYSNIRRFLNEGQLPPKDAVRIEEMVNYFTYDYPAPAKGGEAPFSSSVEIASCPWNSQNRLVRVALKGMEVASDQRPMTNLVFLIDVSGSMKPENKLPLLKRSMQMLVDQLGANDRVAIVVYAGSSGLVLPSTPCDEAQKGSILHALESLHAGGSTNGGQGIELAYNIATENFIEGGVNRVILCTDGDFNVGITDQGALTRLIEDKAKTGVFLSVLGFGMGNVKDATMEILTNKGNGNYAYIDTINEARKVLVEQLSGTLVTIAKDVKIQVEFNPAQVQSYRLIGYENRMLAKEDFNDDAKDAGEIGAGHTVTALYEVVPAGKDAPSPTTQAVDDLKYQTKTQLSDVAGSGEALTLKLRYKDPDGDTSKLLEFPVKDGGATYAQASEDFKFAASVAALGMILRDSPHKGQVTLDGVIELAEEGKGRDQHGYRTEFIELVRKTKELGK